MATTLSMSTSHINGTRIAQQQPCKLGRSESGSFSEIPFETTSQDEFNKLVLLANISGVTYDAQQTFGKGSVTFKYPYNFSVDPASEPPVDLWELISNKVEKSIIEADGFYANQLTQSDINQLNKLLADVNQYIYQIGDAIPTVPAGLKVGDLVLNTDPNNGKTGIQFSNQDPNGAPVMLAKFLIMGVTSKIVFAPTIRFTQTVNSAYPIQASQQNVGQIISTNNLYSLANIPNNLLFALPNDADPILDPSRPVLHYGWFKDSPEVRQIARLKWQIIYTWEYGLWPEVLFGIPL